MSAARAKSKTSGDWKILIGLVAAMAVVLMVVSYFGRTSSQDDQRPLSTNTANGGAKAVYLTLEGMGKHVRRWDKPLADLDSVPAEKTTLILAEPTFAVEERKKEASDLKRFLMRGGHVLMTGAKWTVLLPGADVGAPRPFQGDTICFTTPEGPGALARAGEVEMQDEGSWDASGPQFRVEQRCGKDAVVVRYAVGAGEVVWWSSAHPLTNAGLKKESNLKLLLASLNGESGGERDVLFDDYAQDLHGEAKNPIEGLPLGSVYLQLAVIFALVVFSFSRRKGPLRMPVEVPRTSPVEFATSMGDLYEKAGATDAATDAARRKLLWMLQREAGIGRTTMEEGPDAIADTLHVRLRGDWRELAEHLKSTEAARRDRLNPRSALALIRALGEDEERVRAATRPAEAPKVLEGDVQLAGDR